VRAFLNNESSPTRGSRSSDTLFGAWDGGEGGGGGGGVIGGEEGCGRNECWFVWGRDTKKDKFFKERGIFYFW